MGYTTRFGKVMRTGRRRRGYDVTHLPAMPIDKGQCGGHCNRSACLAPGATWYNHGSRAYYCEECAYMLNNDPVNKADAHRLFGHDLCTPAYLEDK